ncbi:MAG: hypothetical protein A3F68_01580 [Acidobacteria bacterium RIFCSPLOWO2_12_FULL_54_10]|nr:MAG: hypothetical protein A3F68_01580 [Acidobacteria bacterium RIFCSPLOWO2_12_FULL_54_10]
MPMAKNQEQKTNENAEPQAENSFVKPGKRFWGKQQDIRMLLVGGFGAMLLLILFSGLEAIRINGDIRREATTMRNRFIETEQVLSNVRTNLLWASIWIDDFLRSRTDGTDDFYRRQLWGIRQELQIAWTQQAMAPLTTEQTETWNRLRMQVENFWTMVEPVLNSAQRLDTQQADRALREEMVARRSAILKLTDEFTELNRGVLQNQSVAIEKWADDFRTRMILNVLLSTLVGAIVAFWTVRYARRLETKLQEQIQESVTSKHNLERLSARVVDLQEEERRAISRELHDQIGQALTAIRVNLGMIEKKVAASGARELVERIRESKVLAEQTMQEIRDLSRLLRPSMLDDLGLVPALEWYARSLTKRSGIPVQLEISKNIGRLPEQWETSLYRSVQEALTNTIRHSEATKVYIRLETADDRLVLTVEDNGHGFNPNRSSGGLGLIGMKERARQLGGTATFDSLKPAGARVRIELPLPPQAVTVGEETASEVIS